MSTVLLVLVVVLVVAGLVYGVVSLLAGDDAGLAPVDPDGVARPLPNNRSLTEFDLKAVRFDVELRGYRMGQVDRVLRRTAYDVGYKDEMIAVLEAEVVALREGRVEDADLLRKARESAASTTPTPPAGPRPGAAEGDFLGPGTVDAVVLEPGLAGFTALDNGSGTANGAGLNVRSDSAELDEDDEPPFTDTGAGRLNRAALRVVTEDLPVVASPVSSAPVSSAPVSSAPVSSEPPVSSELPDVVGDEPDADAVADEVDELDGASESAAETDPAHRGARA
jgi:DivIVA domain-containing protein